MRSRPQQKKPLLVQKFGGSSLRDPQYILKAAERVVRSLGQGYRVVVVVSAMHGETNRLLAAGHQISEGGDRRDGSLGAAAALQELDAIASTGEQVSASLMSLAIQRLGHHARSFMAAQLPILTDSHFGNANIREVNAAPLRMALARGEVPVVAGFQGIDSGGRVTTLGRGGSDTTAVALSAALRADRCQVYKDVDGIYVADPHLIPFARKIAQLPYDQMILLSLLGAKILHPRSVALGAKANVPIEVLSAFSDVPGTLISRKTSEPQAFGVTCAKAEDSASLCAVSVVGCRPVSSSALDRLRDHLEENSIPIFALRRRSLSASFHVRESDSIPAQKLLVQRLNHYSMGTIV